MRDWRVAMLMVVIITVLLRLDATAKAECNTALPTLYQQVSPAVVFISAVSVASVHPGERVGTVVGSGVLMDRGGTYPDELPRRLWTSRHLRHPR